MLECGPSACAAPRLERSCRIGVNGDAFMGRTIRGALTGVVTAFVTSRLIVFDSSAGKALTAESSALAP